MKKQCSRCLMRDNRERKEGEEVIFQSWSDYIRKGKKFSKLYISENKKVWLCHDCLNQVEENRKK